MEMVRRMSARLFIHWQWYGEFEPFDERRGDLRAAQVAATIANANRDPKKRPRPFTVDEMVMKFGEVPKGPMPVDMQKRMLMAIAMAHSNDG